MGAFPVMGTCTSACGPRTSSKARVIGMAMDGAIVGEEGGEEASEPISTDMASVSGSSVRRHGYCWGVYSPRRPHLPIAGPKRAMTVACGTYHLCAACRFCITRARTCPWELVFPPATWYVAPSGNIWAECSPIIPAVSHHVEGATRIMRMGRGRESSVCISPTIVAVSGVTTVLGTHTPLSPPYRSV